MSISNRYDQIIVGKSYPSLAFAISQKALRGKKNLVIDDKRLVIGDKWIHNIGRLELKALQRLGEMTSVSCLKYIDKYVEPTNTMIFLNERMVELGGSPFSNIKELARKLPECFSEEFIKSLGDIDPEEFDNEADAFFDQTLDSSFGAQASNQSIQEIFRPASNSLAPVFEKFASKFTQKSEGDTLITHQLRYILQALYQTIVSNVLSDTEARYLLAEAMSPRYTVDAARLEDELSFAYKSMGGDTKQTTVAQFQIYNKKLEHVLLDSYEGVIKTQKVYLFGHFGKEVPFDYAPGRAVYHSIRAQAPLERKFAQGFAGKRIIFSSAERMGTDFPHWEINIDENMHLNATYVYAKYEGSKPAFYQKSASEDLYRSLKEIFPGLNKDDWTSQAVFSQGVDVWLDNPKESDSAKRLKLGKGDSAACFQGGSRIKGVEYCGPLRSRFLGYFGYFLDLMGAYTGKNARL